MRQGICHVSDIPDLVGLCASPQLDLDTNVRTQSNRGTSTGSTYLVTGRSACIRQVHAHAMIRPCNVVVTPGLEKNASAFPQGGIHDATTYSVIELLVGVLVVRACPHLQLHTVRCASTSNVQALVAVDLNGSAGECPLLSVGTSTGLNGSRSTIGVGCRQAECYGVKDQNRIEVVYSRGNSPLLTPGWMSRSPVNLRKRAKLDGVRSSEAIDGVRRDLSIHCSSSEESEE